MKYLEDSKDVCMTWREINEINLVDYLANLGFRPVKVRGDDYWYLSPLREESEASFKINARKNLWYDHGAGIGNAVMEFTMAFYNCDISTALEILANTTSKSLNPSYNFFSPKSLVHSHSPVTGTTGIVIIEVKPRVTDLRLSRYLKERRIDSQVATKYLNEVYFKNGLIDTIFKAIGFQNKSGGFELRNEYFKGSSSPKDIYIDNHEADKLSVFEGFFDFLSFETVMLNQQVGPTDMLVLNSLSFLERSIPILDRHKHVDLYLDHDAAGRRATSKALAHSPAVVDRSDLYLGYKDFNDWTINFGKSAVLGKKLKGKIEKRI